MTVVEYKVAVWLHDADSDRSVDGVRRPKRSARCVEYEVTVELERHGHWRVAQIGAPLLLVDEGRAIDGARGAHASSASLPPLRRNVVGGRSVERVQRVLLAVT
jgi:hypothetical protein